MSKSKPITTSVPSFAIRFHAGGEELEELYPSEEEEKSAADDQNVSSTAETSKQESSPMRDYLNKIGKRSSSIDAGIDQQQSSDPWRIFSEFKGKLTKTVEEKLSEIKSKNDGDNSPKLASKAMSRENSNVSDSEEQSYSECSVPKSTLNSTTEDLEMSSDDDASFADSEKTPTEEIEKNVVRKRTKPIKVTYNKDSEHTSMANLSPVYEKSTKGKESEIESGIEAYEDFVDFDLEQNDEQFFSTLMAPKGFVDVRSRSISSTQESLFFVYGKWIFICALLLVLLIYILPSFTNGFLFGVSITVVCFKIHDFLKNTNAVEAQSKKKETVPIVEIAAAKEYQPVTKFEGWVNEYPERYDPYTYHIAKTQSVFLKLENSVLRVSHTRCKIPKRAMWDEAKHDVSFTFHRYYNLKGAQVLLLPDGLTRKRLWSKKYPICIILDKETMHEGLPSKNRVERNEEDSIEEQEDEEEEVGSVEDEEEWETLDETKLYIFGRADRDKEDWFRRLACASKNSPEAELEQDPEPDPDWLNSLGGRIIQDIFRNPAALVQIQERVQRKLATIKLPYFIEELAVSELSFGNGAPRCLSSSLPQRDERGLWLDLEIEFSGLVSMALATKLNLMKLKEQAGRADESAPEAARSPMFHSDVEDSAESSSDEEVWQPPTGDSRKLLRMVDRIAASRYFQQATDYKVVKRAMEGVSRTELKLVVELRLLRGSLALNLPPSPSDRLWLGFRANPELQLSARPTIGERSVNLTHLTRWIENKLRLEFQKVLVLPNMEDLIVPLMNPRLPP